MRWLSSSWPSPSSLSPSLSFTLDFDQSSPYPGFASSTTSSPDGGVEISYGTVLKLMHDKTKVRLHSHDVPYGSGSGQQSVTGFPTVDDSNSYWIVRPEPDTSAKQGDAIRTGTIIRLQHMRTRRWLHSYLHASPISGNLEQSHLQHQPHLQPQPYNFQPLTMIPHPNPQPVQHLIRGDRHLFSTSDDTVMMRQIQTTHPPDGREVDVKPLLNVIKDILQCATPGIQSIGHPSSQAQIDAYEDKNQHIDFVGMLEALAYTIHKISCEITCKCSGGSDAHATTLALFNTLSSYSWDGKVVLALAAFAVSYGEFWLVAQLYPTNPLAKLIALLKKLPDILEHNESLKPRFDALKNLISEMFCTVLFFQGFECFVIPTLLSVLTFIKTSTRFTRSSAQSLSYIT